MIPSQPAAIPLTMALLAAAGVSQQKPVKEVPLVINYAVKPITLERATARAHAVVRARVVGSQFRDLREPGVPVPNMNTVYALNVVEVLKRDPNLPVPTQVVRSGGDLETDEGIRRYVEDGFPAFQPGEEYLLFLYWNENLATYQMFFGVTARIASPLRTGSTRSVVACWHSVTRGRTLVRSLIGFARSLPSCVL